MKSQKKQMIVLAVILVVLVAVYLGLRVWNSRPAQEENTAGEPVQKLVGLTDLAQISFTAPDGSALSFVKDNGVWISAQEPDLPLIQSKLDTIETAFGTLEYQRALEEHDALDGYGLKPAVRTVIGTDTQGNECTILFGNEIDYEGVYYAMIDGRDVIYTVPGDLYGATDFDLMELAEVETLPEIDEEKLKTIALSTADGEVVLNKLIEKVQKVQEQETGEVDESGKAVTERVTTTVEIYHWNMADGTEVPEENTVLVNVLNELSALSFSSVCDFRPEAEKLDIYGLAEPAAVLTLQFQDGTQMVLHLGSVDEREQYCYGKLDDSERIHQILLSDVDEILSMTPESLTSLPEPEGE